VAAGPTGGADFAGWRSPAGHHTAYLPGACVPPVLWQGSLVLVLLLAGCSGPASSGDGPAGPIHGALLHDEWWGARTQIPLVDTSIQLIPVPAEPFGCPDDLFVPVDEDIKTNCKRIALPPGVVILPGTARINVTLTWQSTSALPPLASLYYRTPSSDWVKKSASAGFVEIVVHEHSVDPVFAEHSRWEFMVRANMFWAGVHEMRVNMVADRQQGPLDGPEAPQDEWGNATSKRLFDEAGRMSYAAGQPTDPTGANSMPAGLNPSRVPTNSSKLELVVHYNSSSDPALHFRPTLIWSPPGTAAQFEMSPQSRIKANGMHQWTIELVPDMWDTHGRALSEWELYIDWRSGKPFVDAVVMDGDYHVTLDVFRE
jgi:hypothetical protein